MALAAGAFVAIWGGWVDLGQMAGFGPVNLLPGIMNLTVNLAITLPLGMEVYAAFALGVWLTHRNVRPAARTFAGWSVLASLGAATILGSAIEASITVRQQGISVRVGSSTDAAARCDQAEVRTDAGPCIDAMIDTTIRLVPQIANEDRWPAWREQAVREGFVSAVAVPALAVRDVTVALDLYSREPDPWTPELLTAVDGYAQLVAAMVRLQLKAAQLEDAATGLCSHMSDAGVTERAVGAIMHNNACGREDAQRILDFASRDRNVSRREVAETVSRAFIVPDDRPEGEGLSSW